MPAFGAKVLVLVGAVMFYILAWEGNVGIGLACIVAPGAVLTDRSSTSGESAQVKA